MTLPNYFLADLPPEATLSATMLHDACQTLRHNREKYLLPRTTQSIIRTLSHLASEWRESTNPFRQIALEAGPAATGFSRQTLAAGLDGFFEAITTEHLQALVDQDLGHLQRLETLTTTETEQRADRASHARGPELLVHITGGVLPNPALTSIILGLLTRSAQFVKCASGTALLPRLFAHSLYQAEPKLGACLEIAEWKGGTSALDTALFAEADCLTATGHDETLAALRQKIPARTRFLGYGHRLSFAYVTQEVLSGFHPHKIIASAARDVVAWDQLGCLSPHVIYVETGGRVAPEDFAAKLATELAACERTHPRGQLAPEAAAAIAARRGFYEVRAANSRETKLWTSPGSTAWTVVFETEPLFQLSCLHRFIYVKAVADLKQALEAADAVRGKVSTVGLAAPEDRALSLAHELARWGVTRICPLGHMQNPPLRWRHDGRPSLGDLVTWTDWEL
ncbi:MAG: hypothetical protein HYY24_12530 [Verrucomicrobia bacterium]|nr:hypothetical protein [Verrucomicrobiota bacterium]